MDSKENSPFPFLSLAASGLCFPAVMSSALPIDELVFPTLVHNEQDPAASGFIPASAVMHHFVAKQTFSTVTYVFVTLVSWVYGF